MNTAQTRNTMKEPIPMTQAQRTHEAYKNAAESLKDLDRLCASFEITDTPETTVELRALQNSLEWLKRSCDNLHRMHVMSVEVANGLKQQTIVRKGK